MNGLRLTLLVILCFVGVIAVPMALSQPIATKSAAVWGGLWLATLLAWGIDAINWARLERWLSSGAKHDMTGIATRGLADTLSFRVQRLLRQRDTKVAVADARLAEFLSAIQVSPNGVTLLSTDGRIEWCNTTSAQHFGLYLERDLAQLVGNLVRDPAFNRYLQAGDFTGEVVVERPGALRLAVQLHRYDQGRMLMLSRDVTALEQAAQMRRDFVANVSHEIRTPLTVLHGFVETLRTVEFSVAEQQRYLGLMAQQSSRMQDLVSDLPALSKLESLPQAPTDRLFSLDESLLKIEQQTQQIIGLGGKLSLNVAPQAQGLQLAGIESELVSALTNLLTNAVRYSPVAAHTRLAVELTTRGDLTFSVRDEGPGIEAHHLPRLTERFYRVDSGRSRETGGTGLGLAIVKTVMLRHGGQLLIDSTVGQGSCFTLVLPAHRVHAPSGAKL